VRPSLAQSAFGWMLGEHPLGSEKDGGEVGLSTGEGGGSNDRNSQLFSAGEDSNRSGSLKGKRNKNQAMLFGAK